MSQPSTVSSKSYRDTAIVLRAQQLGEADRIIIMLTREHGVVHAVAKGVRRSSSKIGARLEPFMVVDVSLVAGKNLETVSQVQTRRAYTASLMSDYEAFMVACVLAELTEVLTRYEFDQNLAFFDVLAGALSSLARKIHHPCDVLNAFITRAMMLAGWQLNFENCVLCGDSLLVTYLSAEYGFIDAACSSAVNQRVYPVAHDVKSYIQAVHTAQWHLVDALTTEEVRMQSLKVLGHYVRWHLEKPVKTLDSLVKDIHAH